MDCHIISDGQIQYNVVEYPEYQVDLNELAEKYGGLCSVESHYESNFVDELEKYEKEYLTEHDYILRIETKNDDMELKKQTIYIWVTQQSIQAVWRAEAE